MSEFRSMFKSNDKSRTITPKQVLIIFAAILWVYATGIVRDTLFVGINQSLGVSGPGHAAHLYSGQVLIVFKWLLTLLFSLLYFGYCMLLIRLLFPAKVLYRLCILLYSGLFAASLFISLAGKIIGFTEQGYRISRDIAGLIQSPILIMLFCGAIMLYRTLPQEKK